VIAVFGIRIGNDFPASAEQATESIYLSFESKISQTAFNEVTGGIGQKG